MRYIQLNKMGHSVQRVNSYSPSAFLHGVRKTTVVSLIYDRQGRRKYLTTAERTAFLRTASGMSPEMATFCAVLAYTGARLSEARALTPASVDLAAGVVVFETLKKRRRGIYRAVPVPPDVLQQFDAVHGITAAQQKSNLAARPLWSWSRTTAWTRIKIVMAAAEVRGPQATPKGLRHGFAVGALQAGVPINLVRRWLGHARLSTTEIYAEAIGAEEQAIARRFWESF
jgi:integrase